MIIAARHRIDEYRAKGWWGEATVDDRFKANALATPDREAVVDPPNRPAFTDGAPRRLSYRELDRDVDRLSAALLESGVAKDDVVAVQLPNIVELTVAYLACARIGAIITPLPVQYREHELAYMLEHTQARVAVTAVRIGAHPHAAMICGLRANLHALRAVLAFGSPVPTGCIALDPVMARDADPAPLQRHRAAYRPSADDVFTICWTSGTEARSKGVPRSHNEWLVIGPTIVEAAALQPGCRQLNPSPLVNMSGVSVNIATWLDHGGTVVHHHPFDLPTLLQQMREERLDYIVAPPAVLNMLLQQPELMTGIDFGRLKRIGSGGAPLSSWMVRGFAERFGVEIINHYGSNEGAALAGTSFDIPEPERRASYFPRIGQAGVPCALRQLDKVSTRLVDPATGAQITEPGIPGELCFRGPTIFSGYWKAPELSARAFDSDGYYRTGDLFEIAGERSQYYRFVGRVKDIVVRGGMNISAEEIETLALEHPCVREAAVIGLPDAIMGERVCLVVAPKPGTRVDLDDVNRFLREEKRIAIYKQPERLLVVDALPRNPVGKILKRELRSRIEAEIARNREQTG